MDRPTLRIPILLGGLVAMAFLSVELMPAGHARGKPEEIKDDQKFDDEVTGFGFVRPDEKKWMYVAPAEFRDNENMVAILRKYAVDDPEQQKTQNPLLEFQVTCYEHGKKWTFSLPDGKKKDASATDIGPLASIFAAYAKKEFKEFKVKREPGTTAVPCAKGGKEYAYGGTGNSAPALHIRGVVFAFTQNKYTFHVQLIAYEGSEDKEKDGIKYVWDRMHVTKIKKRK